MISFLNQRKKSFSHAAHGILYVLRTQPNTWIHALATILVVALGFWIGLTTVDWAILILTIAFVWTAEFFNTAIEAVVDLIQPEYHPYAKAAKDAAAAAVLIGAICSIGIGVLILGPGLLNRLLH